MKHSVEFSKLNWINFFCVFFFFLFWHSIIMQYQFVFAEKPNENDFFPAYSMAGFEQIYTVGPNQSGQGLPYAVEDPETASGGESCTDTTSSGELYTDTTSVAELNNRDGSTLQKGLYCSENSPRIQEFKKISLLYTFRIYMREIIILIGYNHLIPCSRESWTKAASPSAQ